MPPPPSSQLMTPTSADAGFAATNENETVPTRARAAVRKRLLPFIDAPFRDRWCSRPVGAASNHVPCGSSAASHRRLDVPTCGQARASRISKRRRVMTRIAKSAGDGACTAVSTVGPRRHCRTRPRRPGRLHSSIPDGRWHRETRKTFGRTSSYFRPGVLIRLASTMLHGAERYACSR